GPSRDPRKPAHHAVVAVSVHARQCRGGRPRAALLLFRRGRHRFDGADSRPARGHGSGPLPPQGRHRGQSEAPDYEVEKQHYAFLVSEKEFDEIFGRIKKRGLDYWADPRKSQKGEINHHDGGRGVYFEDPSGHFLEIITRPYGGG